MESANYTCVSIGGEDRLTFLQGQLTQDVTGIDDAISLPAAWCNAKGRVVVTCRLLAQSAAIGLVIPTVAVDSVTRRLALYRLRADVSIETVPAFRVLAFAGEAGLAALESAGLGRLHDAAPCCRSLGLIAVRYPPPARFIEVFGAETAFRATGLDARLALDAEAWRAARIAAGLVDIGGDNVERYTPHMLNLDRTGAVSFTKGCYTGQEVVARTEHRGRVKRRVNRYRLDGASAAVGDKLRLAGRDVGAVVNACDAEILAVTPVAEHGEALEIGCGKAVPMPLPYSLD